MNLTCYIIDDERYAIDILRDYIERTPGLELQGSSTEPLDALKDISSTPPDLLFLDVDMPELNGLELAGLVKGLTTVIFTTAYREYAVEAFEKQALDYLVKPVFYERFLASVQRARRELLNRGPATGQFLLVTSGVKGKLVRVAVADITHIEGADAYIQIYSKNDKIMTYLSLAEIIKRLPESQFTRVHKSYIIRDDLVKLIEPGQLTLRSGLCLPVGPAYREAFRRKMGPDPAERY